MSTNTNHGKLSVSRGVDAAKLALEPLAKYTDWVNGDFRGYFEGTASKSSKVDKVGAGAGVVGAIAGIAGLVKSSDKDGDVLEIDVVNYSNHPIIPFNFVTSRCSLEESPRPILISDHSLIRCSWDGGFETGTSEVNAEFLVSSWYSIKVKFCWQLKSGPIWGVDHVTVDDTTQSINFNDNYGELCCAVFDSNEPVNRPSFKVFFHTVLSETAKTFIAFTPA